MLSFFIDTLFYVSFLIKLFTVMENNLSNRCRLFKSPCSTSNKIISSHIMALAAFLYVTCTFDITIPTLALAPKWPLVFNSCSIALSKISYENVDVHNNKSSTCWLTKNYCLTIFEGSWCRLVTISPDCF